MDTCMDGSPIRELQDEEIERVAAGLTLGTGPTGIFSAGNVAAGLRLVGGIGLLATSAKFGWDLGTYGYKSYTSYKYSTR